MLQSNNITVIILLTFQFSLHPMFALLFWKSGFHCVSWALTVDNFARGQALVSADSHQSIYTCLWSDTVQYLFLWWYGGGGGTKNFWLHQKKNTLASTKFFLFMMDVVYKTLTWQKFCVLLYILLFGICFPQPVMSQMPRSPLLSSQAGYFTLAEPSLVRQKPFGFRVYLI